jgi:outer membrane protein OmpA-like peptidoglycan-associated protein
MQYIPRKIKLVVSFLAVIAISAFAGDGNMNYYGQLGVHKTQSAQTLGHGVFGLGLFFEGASLGALVENSEIYDIYGNNPPERHEIISFIGMNGYPFLSLGLSDYFDFSISLPLYGEILKRDDVGLSEFGQGDLQISTKIRVPFNEDFPLDIALLSSFFVNTGRIGEENGRWVHDPAFLNKNGNPIGEASNYTNGNLMLKIGGAMTLDFNRMKAKFPLLIHLNGAHRMSLGTDGSDYPGVTNFSFAFELTPVQYISVFSEYYRDFPAAFPKLSDGEDYAPTSTVTGGLSFHLGKKVDLQLGAQILTHDEDKYIDSLISPASPASPKRTWNAALIPKWVVFGGLTFKIFTVEPEEEYRNPDTDEDGVCDPWVSETGRQREFARECKGIDLCPYEEGDLKNKGCPEESEDAPTIIFDVNPDAISSGQSATLSWIVTNATEVSIEGLGNVPLKGTRRVKPSETTTYTITAKGGGGTKTEALEIIVDSAPGPAIIFNASPESVQKGQLVTLTWVVTEATEVSIEGIGKVPVKGMKKVKVSDAGITTFSLTATGPGGTKTEALEIEVLAGPIPTILFNASSGSIKAGETVTLNWQVSNAAEVVLEGVGKVPAKGTKKVKPVENTLYTITATGEGGTETATVEIEVGEPPPIEARVNLQGVTFGSGNATLTPNAKKVLDGIAEQLLASPSVKIEIQGHTDNVGNPKSNLELSERRAKAVVGYLAIKGVKMSRMSAVGFGQDAPIADNKTKEGKELNRRIEMIRVD